MLVLENEGNWNWLSFGNKTQRNLCAGFPFSTPRERFSNKLLQTTAYPPRLSCTVSPLTGQPLLQAFLYRRGTLFNADSGIHDPAALSWREGEDRVQVEFADLGDFFDEAREPQQYLFDGLHIRCRMASVAL